MALEELCYKLKSEVLHCLVDLTSLKAVVHASPCFYHVYEDVRQSAISTVVQREIHPEVSADALAVHDSSELESYGPDQVEPFVLKYEANRQEKLAAPLPIPLSMELLAFYKKYVEYFANEFASLILSSHHASKQP